MLASATVLALLPLLALAQYDSAPATTSIMVPSGPGVAMPPASSSMPGTAMTYKVVVGGGPLVYIPNFVTASIGDLVQFSFASVNHSMTQSSFATPCSHLVGPDGTTPIGVDSGFVPVPMNIPSGTNPTFTITVTSMDPLYFYCRQGAHCSNGMVFAINPPSSGNTITAFIANAMANPIASPFVSSYRLNGTGVYANSPVVLASMTSTAVSGTSASVTAMSSSVAGSMTMATTAAGSAASSAGAPAATKSAGSRTSTQFSIVGFVLIGVCGFVIL